MPALRQYLAVWRLPGAPVLLLGGVVARLGIGMTPLALLLLARQVTGGYAPAALTGAVYALAAALLGPLAGRIADRVGPAPVLLATAVAHPVGLAAVLIAAAAGRNAFPIMLVAAGFAGATYPPLTAGIRGALNVLTAPTGSWHALRNTALAAEVSLFELVFVLGPILVAFFLVVAGPAAAIIAAALVTGAGTITVARGRAIRGFTSRPAAERTRGLGPLRVTGFPALLLCVAGLGVAFGTAGVVVPAYATTSAAGDAEEVAGILLAVWGLGSAAGGFWFGARRPAAAPARQFAWLLAGVSASFVVYALMPHPVALGVALVLGGATIAPALTVGNALVGRIIPDGMFTEAYTWIVTVSASAGAAGGSISGLIVDQPGGVPWGFGFAAAAVALATLTAALPGGSIARTDARTA